MTFNEITPKELYERYLQDQTICAIDVREVNEWNEIHWPGAVHHPLSSFDPASISENLGLQKEKPVYFICRSGARSSRAAQMMIEIGYLEVFNLVGGMMAWDSEGLPCEKQK